MSLLCSSVLSLFFCSMDEKFAVADVNDSRGRAGAVVGSCRHFGDESCTLSIIRQDEGPCLCHAETNGAGCPGADSCRCTAADGISRHCGCAAREVFPVDSGRWAGTERSAG